MKNLPRFHSIADALRAGFSFYDRTADGYLMRKKIKESWHFARIIIRHAA